MTTHHTEVRIMFTHPDPIMTVTLVKWIVMPMLTPGTELVYDTAGNSVRVDRGSYAPLKQCPQSTTWGVQIVSGTVTWPDDEEALRIRRERIQKMRTRGWHVIERL